MILMAAMITATATMIAIAAVWFTWKKTTGRPLVRWLVLPGVVIAALLTVAVGNEFAKTSAIQTISEASLRKQQAGTVVDNPQMALVDENWDNCTNSEKYDYRMVIPACSSVIARGAAESRDRQATAYLKRAGQVGFYKGERPIGDVEAALSDLNKAVELNRNEENLQKRAGFLMGRKEYDLAIADLNEAMMLSKKAGLPVSPLYISRARAYEKKGMIDVAIQDADTAIKLDPKETWHLVSRAHIHMRNDKYSMALVDLDTYARSTDYPASYALLSRGNVHEKLGNYAAALADYDAAGKRYGSDEIREAQARVRLLLSRR